VPGVWCNRCKTQVLLEQDGQSCSNCGRKLVIRAPKPPPPRRAPPNPQPPAVSARKRRPSAANKPAQAA